MTGENGFVLENDVEVPFIGYGTYKVKQEEAERIIGEALEAGYRHLDTASIYKNETAVGNAVKHSGIQRRDLFLTSKLWKDSLGYDETLREVDKTLERLSTNYLDLYLIHWPLSHPDCADWKKQDREAWRAMERLYNEGAVRAIGVSNFLPHHLMNLLNGDIKIRPMVNQLEYHPGYIQQTAVAFSQSQGLQVEAWSPLGRTRILDDPFIVELAKKYGKTPAQLCIRFAMQNNVLPLPKSSSMERMKENLDVMDFDISMEDMYRIMCMPQTGWSGNHPDTFD